MYRLTTILLLSFCIELAICGDFHDNKIDNKNDKEKKPVPCTCGIFLSGQFDKGSKEPPKENPVFLQETDNHFISGLAGSRMCTTKCLELVSI